MTFAEFCMLLLAFAILSLVRILASILQEHRSEATNRPQVSAILNAAPPRHRGINNRSNDPGNSDQRAPPVLERAPSRLTRLRARFESPALPSVRSVADAVVSSIPNLSLPSRPLRAQDIVSSTSTGHPSSLSAGPSTARSSLAGPVAGPSTAVAGPSTAVAGPSTAVAGPSTAVAGPSTAVAGPSTAVAGPSMARSTLSGLVAGLSTGGPSVLLDTSLGGSVPWSPKKGWTSTVRVNGVAYHRTEKKMRPRKSLKAGAEETELIITPYWEPENVGSILIGYPPNLSREPSLQIGDIFVFHTATHYRIWIYRGGGYWQRIEVGYRREDGRYLIVTPVRKEPSWVSREYFERQAAKQAELDSD